MSDNYFDQFVIPHDNLLIIIWDIIMIFLKVFSGLFCLILASFKEPKNPEQTQNLMIMIYILEAIFFIDFLMCFFKEFLGPDIRT